MYVEVMSIKLKDVETRVIKENDGTYAIACSALGVYTVGKTLAEAKKNFEEALDLHLSVLKEKAIEEIARTV
jgi:predicted RNase H-like HicB family nuclease/predicted RNA binding protein YcfA (HicA-like mRNA interferase family)